MPRGFSDYDTARLQGRLWSPPTIRPDNWYDAEQLGTFSLTSGNEISQWNDLGSRGANLTPISGGTRATLQIDSRFGKPSVFYPNNNSSLVTSTARTYTDVTVIVAFFNPQQNPPGGTSNQRIYFQDNSGSWIVISTVGFAGAVAGDYIARLGTNPYAQINFGSFDQPHIATLFSESASSTGLLLADGGKTSGSFTPNAAANSIFGVGCSNINDTRSLVNGRIFELVLAERALSRRERWATEGYLSWKWGIPLAADHPFVNRPPLIGD